MAHLCTLRRSRHWAGWSFTLTVGAVLFATAVAVAQQQQATPARESTLTLRVVHAETGEPIAAAQVERWSAEAARLYEQVGETAADGALAVPVSTPTNFVRLRVRAEGYKPLEVSWESAQKGDLEDWPLRELPETYTLKMHPGVRIGGVVQDESGRPVPGAFVKFTRFSTSEDFNKQDLEATKPPGQAPAPEDEQKSWPRISDGFSADWTRADENGRWSWANVSRIDRLHAEAFTHDHVSAYPGPTSEELLAGEAVMKVKPGVRVAGVVTDARGQPVAGARVWADAGEGAGSRWSWDDWDAVRPGGCGCGVRTETDEQGRFVLPALSPQVVTVYAAAPGHGPGSGHANLSPSQVGERAPLDIQLTPATTLAGRVIDPQGLPIANAYLNISSWRDDSNGIRARTRSDADGRFRFANLAPEPVTLDVSARSYAYHNAVLTPGEQAEQQITLRPQMRLRGSVTDARTGEPVRAFRVIEGYSLWPHRPPMFAFQNGMPVFADGQYEMQLSGNPGSHRTVVRIEAAGYRPGISDSLEAGDAVFDAKLEPAAEITGVVTGPDGAPLPGAQVIVALPGHQVSVYDGKTDLYGTPATVTDAAGRYALPPQTGPFELLVLHDKGCALLHLEGEAIAAERPVNVALNAWAVVEGRFVLPGEDGRPVNYFTINANPYRHPQDPAAMIIWQGSVAVSEDGAYRFERFPDFGGRPVPVGFQVRTPYDHRSFPVQLAPGQAVRVDIAEGAAGTRTVTGRLVLEGGGELPAGWSGLMVAPLQFPPPAEVPADPQQAMALAQPAYSQVPQSDGAFRIPALPPGRYSLIGSITITHDQVYSGTAVVDVPEGEGEVDVGSVVLAAQPTRAEEVRLPEVLALRTDDGAPIRSQDLRGRHTLVLLYGLHDYSTVGRLDDLKTLTAALGPLAADDQLSLLAISVDRVLSGIPLRPQPLGALAEAPWQQAYLDPAQQDTSRRLGVNSYPWLLLIGPDGGTAWFGADLDEAAAQAQRVLAK